MKGKKRFTRSEIEKIKNLTHMKISASSSKQKQIRNKIRSIGFYYSDFSSAKGYTVEDIELLIRNGEIKIVSGSGETKNSKISEYSQVKYKAEINPKQNIKNKKPLIIKATKELVNPEYGLDPLIDENVKFLILGTFPAKESLDANFYYQNQIKRFWGQALRRIGSLENITNVERKEILLKNHIGLWDIFEAIQREGSNQDSAIKKAKYNSIAKFIEDHPSITHIIFNGKNAKIWIEDDCPEIFSKTKLEIIRFQSTSGANGWFKEGKDWNEFFNTVLK